MTFARLTRGDAVATVAALALLLLMSLDWYGTVRGDEARRTQDLLGPREGPGSGEISRNVEESARLAAEAQEKTAWQAYAFIDLFLLAAAVIALSAAFARAGGRRFEPPGTPSGLAALIGASALLLVAYRLLEEPGNDAVTTTKLGAVLGLLAIGALTLGSLSALRAEQDGSVWAEPEAASQERRVVQTPVE